MKISHRNPKLPRETVINIEGLRRAVTLMHITDSHLSLADGRDPKALPLTRKRELKRPETHARFTEALARSNQLEVDATVLTGDITSFPSWAGIEAIAEGLATLSEPYLYTLGNHDWSFPFLEWNDATRDEYYPRFHSIIDGSPHCQVKEVGGVKLIALDNSNYQISRAQLNFLEEQLSTGLPCMLFIHIPIFIRSLMPAVLKKWKNPIVMAATEGWDSELIARSDFLARETTRMCYKFLTEGASENIVGIFCGHVHFAHADAYRPNRFQYVTDPGFDGGFRLIRLEPNSSS